MTDHSVLQARARFWKAAGAMTAALVVLSTAGIHLDARHAASFVATDLGTLGGNFSVANAVSDKGVVVGQSLTALSESHAFVWTEDRGMIDLGILSSDRGNQSSAALVSSSATLIGNDGVIAGFDSVGSDFHAFVRTHANGLVAIPTLGGSSISPKAINSKGAVVGSSFLLGNKTFHAFLWTQRDGTVDLGTLGGNFSEALAVGDDGVVVGQSATAPLDVPHAFMWTRHGGMVDLGTLGGLNSTAQSVNNDGVVVGTSDIDPMSVEQHAFVWTKRTGMIDIGPGPSGTTSFGDKINGRFVILHTSTKNIDPLMADITRTFVWTEKGGLVDIGTLGGDRSFAVDVSESGVVVGGSSTKGNAAFHGFAWSASMGMVPLESGAGTSQANAIKGNFIVGSSCEAGDVVCHATLWKPSSHSHHHQQDDDDQD